MMENRDLIDKLNKNKMLSEDEWVSLLDTFTDSDMDYAAELARSIAVRIFGKKVYFRGIIEFTNICKNNCYYCGLRAGNSNITRYRLTDEDILSCCESGYLSGFRTFVLQGGEDMFFDDERMVGIISAIRKKYPDCAITLSVGERSRESYEKMFNAGADRFLLRHETADEGHYSELHPKEMSWKNRMNCLKELREIGYQTGAGMMVGTPGEKTDYLAKDMIFLGTFKPEMIGMGPFIPHHDTPFGNEKAGSVRMTLMLLSLCRIMLPDVLLPATTALGTLSEDGRKKGILSGANVIMPNLSPVENRKKYMLYDNKKITGDDAGEALNSLREHMKDIGYELFVGRGDYRHVTAV